MYSYIPHPSNCRASINVQRMLVHEGMAGYGVYWSILEQLRDADQYQMFYFPEGIAFSTHCNDIALIERVCKSYGLFTFDEDDMMASPWLLQQMEAYEEKKNKLREAGREGAKKRWEAKRVADGQAIATPSNNDGQAIAYNVTLPNVTEPNITSPNQTDGVDVESVLNNQGDKVTAELLEALASHQPSGHAPGWLAQVCIRYDMGENVLAALQTLTNNAELTNPLYNRLTSKVREIESKKWRPNMPANYFLRLLTK